MLKISIALFFLFLVVMATFPATLHFTDKMIGDPGDGYQFMGFQYLAYRQFSSGQFPFGWTDYWRYPNGVNFQEISDASLFSLLGVIMYPIFQNPILTYNLSVLILLFFNLVLSYLSFRVLFPRLLSVFGAVMYGLSFYTIARTGGHVNLILHSSIPFFISSMFLVYKEKGSSISFRRLTIAGIVIPLSSLQHPFFLLGSIPILLISLTLFFKKELRDYFKLLQIKKVYLVVSLGVVIGVTFIFHGQKIINFFQNKIHLLSPEILTVPLINFLVPNRYITTFASVIKNDSHRWIEFATFLGYIEIALFILACIFVRSRLKLFLLVTTSAFLLFMIGTPAVASYLWPYQYLVQIFPYRAVLESGRFFIVFYIWFTLLILLFLQQIKSKKVIFILLILLILERLPLSFRLSPNLYDQEFVSAVKSIESKAVFDLPIYTESFFGPKYDLLSIYYQKPIVNGYFHWSADYGDVRQLTDNLSEYRCFRKKSIIPADYSDDKAVDKRNYVIDLLKKYRIRTVVIHKDYDLEKDRCNLARRYIGIFLEDKNSLEKVYEDTNKLVLRLK